MIQVNHIGTWKPDCEASQETMIEKLFEMMERYTLDPVFERYGDFIEENPILIGTRKAADYTTLFGNFFDYSFVFAIDTTDAGLIERFKRAVERNKRTEAYQLARIQREEQEEKRKQHYRKFGT